MPNCVWGAGRFPARSRVSPVSRAVTLPTGRNTSMGIVDRATLPHRGRRGRTVGVKDQLPLRLQLVGIIFRETVCTRPVSV